jgi:arylsulfatase A-like enzyme
VHWPHGIAARGELRHDPGHVIDIVPTILEVAERPRRPDSNVGQAVPPPPGKSLVPAFSHDGSVRHDDLWWEHEGNRAIRMGDWKLVAAGQNGPWELYDLATDRTETQNRAREQPAKVRDLAQRWQALRQEFITLARDDLNATGAAGKVTPEKKLNPVTPSPQSNP